MNKLTIGELFRIALKREKLKQVDLANLLKIDRRSVSQVLKKFDSNRGTINSLIEYADAAGFEVEFNFIKKEEE